MQTSLIVAALKKLLPIGLNMCSPADQELINLAKIRYSLVDMTDFVKLGEQKNLSHQIQVVFELLYLSKWLVYYVLNERRISHRYLKLLLLICRKTQMRR